VEKKYPQFLPQVSTCRSPMSMFSAVVKDYYRNNLPEGKTRHIHVALMPCTAKKFEAGREEFKTQYGPGTDRVVTTQELIKMIRESGIVFNELQPESVDVPFGTMSGAGIIFGVTGGVTEAVLRKIAADNSRTTLAQISYIGVRGMKSVKEAAIPYEGRELKIAVVSGLGNASKLLEKIQSGEAEYDLVEVMACPGGCVSGAGQPYISQRHRVKRGEGLYRTDSVSTIKRSQDNPLMKELYNGMLKGREHELLHVEYKRH
jgi:NADH-quinone oxidoreductase subunit G